MGWTNPSHINAQSESNVLERRFFLALVVKGSSSLLAGCILTILLYISSEVDIFTLWSWIHSFRSCCPFYINLDGSEFIQSFVIPCYSYSYEDIIRIGRTLKFCRPLFQPWCAGTFVLWWRGGARLIIQIINMDSWIKARHNYYTDYFYVYIFYRLSTQYKQVSMIIYTIQPYMMDCNSYQFVYFV